MMRVLGRLAFPLAVVVLIGGGVSLARASVDELALAQSWTSSAPALLGPINSLGRAGWDCVAEKAARATRPRDAELPNDEEK